MFRRNEIKIIVISDYFVREFKGYEYADFILIKNSKIIPKTQAIIKFDKKGKRVAVLDLRSKEKKSKEIEELAEELHRLKVKSETENIVKAIYSISQKSKIQYLLYIGIGIFAGMYFNSFVQQFFNWLNSLPPDVAMEGFKTINTIGTIAMIVGVIGFMIWRLKSGRSEAST